MEQDKSSEYLTRLCTILSKASWNNSYGNFYPSFSPDGLVKLQKLINEVIAASPQPPSDKV